jgi:hypothetical protein
MTFRKCYEIFLFLIGEKLTKINLIHMCRFHIDDRSTMQWGSFLSTPQPPAAVSFGIAGNLKPDENSVLIVDVPGTKSIFYCITGCPNNMELYPEEVKIYLHTYILKICLKLLFLLEIGITFFNWP